jgi:hypothetical protein
MAQSPPEFTPEDCVQKAAELFHLKRCMNSKAYEADPDFMAKRLEFNPELDSSIDQWLGKADNQSFCIAPQCNMSLLAILTTLEHFHGSGEFEKEQFLKELRVLYHPESLQFIRNSLLATRDLTRGVCITLRPGLLAITSMEQAAHTQYRELLELISRYDRQVEVPLNVMVLSLQESMAMNAGPTQVEAMKSLMLSLECTSRCTVLGLGEYSDNARRFADMIMKGYGPKAHTFSSSGLFQLLPGDRAVCLDDMAKLDTGTDLLSQASKICLHQMKRLTAKHHREVRLGFRKAVTKISNMAAAERQPTPPGGVAPQHLPTRRQEKRHQ